MKVANNQTQDQLTLDALRAYKGLESGQVLVLAAENGPIELIHDFEQDYTLESALHSISIIYDTIELLLDTNIISYKVMDMYTRYMVQQDTIIPINTKIYTAG